MMKKQKNRDRLLRIFGSLYEKHYTEEVGCFYCGAPSTEWDHCPPLSWMETIQHDRYRKVLLKSCSDCNSVLGDKPYFTAWERTQAIEEHLSKLLEKTPVIEESWGELDEMKDGPIKWGLVRNKHKLEMLIDRVRACQQRLLNYDSFPQE